jgi:hypothetical protein
MEHEAFVIGKEKPIVKTPTEVRQGTDRPPVLFVLVGGMALATVAFLLMFFVR